MSKIGLVLASPIGLPSLSRLRAATRPLTIVPPRGGHYLGAEVIITHFWCDLSVTVVRVNGVAVIKMVRVRGPFFGREILNRCRRSEMGRNGLIELASHVKVNRASKLLVSEVSQGRSAHELPIRLKDFGGQSQTNIRGRAEITAEDHLSSG